MKKTKSNKEKVRNFVRVAVILFLSMIITIIICKRNYAYNNKILESTVSDAFVFQNILLAHQLEPNKPNSYSDIENLNDDSESFVSDAAIKTGISQYYIRVNYGANCVNIYTKDKEGNYTKPYKSMICSAGISTPKSGTYKVSYKYRWLHLFGDVYGQYATRIVKNILFHSVPYYEQRADTLEWQEYDKLGEKASAGCIRLTVQDSKWIYDNITSGTYVEFYSDVSNPGPLGKPTAKKISNDKKNRNWDPTDPDKNNPWNGGSGVPSITYAPPKNTTSTNSTNTSNTTNSQTNTQNSSKNTSTENNNNTTTSTNRNTTNSVSQTSNTTNTSNNDTSISNITTPSTDNNISTDSSPTPTPSAVPEPVPSTTPEPVTPPTATKEPDVSETVETSQTP